MLFDEMIRANEVKHLCGRLKIDSNRVTVKPISNGLSNRAFRFSYGKKNWMVRLPKNNLKERFQTLDNSTEKRLLQSVSKAGLTPTVIFDDESTGALVTTFLNNAITWDSSMLSQPENLGRIAETLSSLHSINVGFRLPLFKPTTLCESYFNVLKGSQDHKNRTFNIEQKNWQIELRQLAIMYEKTFSPITLCHHDLIAANILDSDQLWLVDFEYAVQAHPILDIASLIALNGLNMNQYPLILESYFKEELIPFNYSQLDDVIRLERLISYFWALVEMDSSVKMSKIEGFAESIAAMLR